MNFDVVRGRVSKPQQTKLLIEAVEKYIKNTNDEGTLYLGYPLTANKDKAVTIDALFVSVNKGMIAFILSSEEEQDILKEEQDSLYYHIDYYLKNYDSLRKGRSLAFNPVVITVLPSKIKYSNKDYIFTDIDGIEKNINKVEKFNKSLYKKLCEILQKVSDLKPKKARNNVKLENSYGAIIKKIEKEIANLDQWQKKAAFEIPEGPQRIRGLAGSGKTIVLALKAAYLHTQYSHMKIAITYYTRSLYQQYVNLISNFVNELSGDEVNWENIDIIHAWGSSSEKGVYSIITDQLNIIPYNLTAAINKFGRQNTFKYVCKEAIEVMNSNFVPIYDAILIDEAQDLPSEFFRLIYNLAKEPKRIVWAYDELQNLTDLEMPTLEEMFGVDSDGNLNINIENYDNEAKRDITLPICYRNPPWTLALAHSIGFGIYHNPILQTFDELESWREIGYTVKSGRLKYNNTVTLSRKNSATPEYFDELLNDKDSLIFKPFDTIQLQYKWIAEQIYKNINEDELDPDDILVIFPNVYTAKSEYIELNKFLTFYGIKSILAGVNTDRDSFRIKENITCSNIYRAKGNEAPMVYIVNSDYCNEGNDIEDTRRLRNILFTGITRARAWVRICYVNSNNNSIIDEIDKCKDNNYELKFKIPSPDEIKEATKLYKKNEHEKVSKIKSNIIDLLELVKSGEIDINDIEQSSEIKELMMLLSRKKKND
ncbi:DEAD/DEAH box helicase (plasmid) [Clostridium perfringens]|uniref:DEAD/DEAH box helicase n=1 Tax=Clostridium perfringens TaxID=1502 RepID=UPI001040B12A|nr:ATP-binding domain-containing protein [Clostridium perfringens]TBX13458.1 RNA helicase [Clostridium perfringens]TBX18883.1 RNA helicase [Clostridium perfringens]HAT4126574.1 ATP-binding domain-containing protein [Clostridium perfringens]